MSGYLMKISLEVFVQSENLSEKGLADAFNKVAKHIFASDENGICDDSIGLMPDDLTLNACEYVDVSGEYEKVTPDLIKFPTFLKQGNLKFVKH